VFKRNVIKTPGRN